MEGTDHPQIKSARRGHNKYSFINASSYDPIPIPRYKWSQKIASNGAGQIWVGSVERRQRQRQTCRKLIRQRERERERERGG